MYIYKGIIFIFLIYILYHKFHLKEQAENNVSSHLFSWLL